MQTALTKEQPGSPEQAARVEDAGTTLERLNAVPADQRTFDNPEWVNFLLYDNQGDIRLAHRSFILDPTHAQIVTRLNGNESIEIEGKASDLVQAQADKLDLANATVVTTGAPVLLKDINDYLRGGMLTLGGIAVAIMVVILLLLFNVRWRLLPLLVILVGVVWAFGLAGYLGIPLTIVTIAGLPVMLGVGIDYAIQMHARVEEEAVLDRSEHPIQETARNLGPGAARRDVRRDLRLRRPALRQGPDDPRLRPAARGRDRRDLPLLDHPAARDPRHPRAPLAHHRQGLPRRRARADRRVPRPRAERVRDPAGDRERRHLRRGASRSKTTSRCRPIRCSGSTRTRRPSRT